MANYYASARSNYFKVKDAEAFKSWLKTVPDVEVREHEGQFALFGNNMDGGGWPSYCYDDNDDYKEFDMFEGIQPFLTDDTVAVFMEAGAEKLRYIVGYAVAVSVKGIVIVSLGDIYALAQTKFGITPTLAEY